MTPQQIEDQIRVIKEASAACSTPGLARKFLRDAGIETNGKIRYQSYGETTLFDDRRRHDFKLLYRILKEPLFNPERIVAKWIITLK